MMNTNRTRSGIRIRTPFIAVFAAVVCSTVPSSAFAAPTCGEGRQRAGYPEASSPYAVPIAALGGQSMAQYLQRHQDSDSRTHTVV